MLARVGARCARVLGMRSSTADTMPPEYNCSAAHSSQAYGPDAYDISDRDIQPRTYIIIHKLLMYNITISTRSVFSNTYFRIACFKKDFNVVITLYQQMYSILLCLQRKNAIVYMK